MPGEEEKVVNENVNQDEIEKAQVIISAERKKKMREIENWVPKTEAGKLVKNGEITTLDQLFDRGIPVLEPEIIDVLAPDMSEKLVDFAKTTRVQRAGRQFSFRAAILLGDGNRYIGFGTGKDKERLPAIKKAVNRAKMTLIRVNRGCGSWECGCGTGHSVPFKVEGRCGSVQIRLLPAPQGTGLVVGESVKDVFRFVGIRDVWAKTRGSPDTVLNFVGAAVDALGKTSKMRYSKDIERKLLKDEQGE